MTAIIDGRCQTPALPASAGTVVAVRGSVVDVRFDGHLPPIYSVLRAGADRQIVIEVLAQRDAHHVRGIALTPTQGLARGMAVEDTGGPLKAPVGKGDPVAHVRRVRQRHRPRAGAVRCRSGARCIARRRRWRDAPPSPRSSRPASRSSTCSCRSSAAARRGCSAARAWARRCCSPR